MRKLILPILAVVLLASCASIFPSEPADYADSADSITDLDRARAIDQQLLKSWDNLADSYNSAWDNIPAIRETLESKVLPVLEGSRVAVLAFHSAVMEWDALGEDMDNMSDLLAEAKKYLEQVKGSLLNVIGGDE